MNLLHEILRAEQRIRPWLRQTPLEFSPVLSQAGQANVYLKLENLQYTGSFKARGALNKLLSLSKAERAAGIVTASSGNHGAAVAHGLHLLHANGVIFVPETVSPAKEANIRRLGGELRHVGDDSAISEGAARRYAEQNGLVYISPYNDPQVVGGQGTVAVELAQQLAPIDAVFVSLGGGGLISGVAGYLKALYDDVQVVACSPLNSNVMEQSVKAGRILDLPSLPTLSDGTAGGVEQGAITFELCRQLVDDYVTVSEAEIASAMRLALETHHMLIEGAAGVAIAGYLRQKERFVGKNVVVVICGANLSLATLRSILDENSTVD
jgi:threonine dehydratase